METAPDTIQVKDRPHLNGENVVIFWLDKKAFYGCCRNNIEGNIYSQFE
ncbi:MAG: hypothetical protein PHT79_07680 [Syntrophomonadaceae bacterium]|nr:hypothetical protein [Syntrophomonadaceae bacterium]